MLRKETGPKWGDAGEDEKKKAILLLLWLLIFAYIHCLFGLWTQTFLSSCHTLPFCVTRPVSVHVCDCGHHTTQPCQTIMSLSTRYVFTTDPGIMSDQAKLGERVFILTSRTKQASHKKINYPTFSICRKQQRQFCQSVVSSLLVTDENYLTDPPSLQLKVGDVP